MGRVSGVIPRRVLAVAAAAVLLLLGAAVPAAGLSAIPDFIGDQVDSITGAADCKTPPKTRSSTSGRANNIDPGPANPRQGDPFGDPPTSTVYEVYGYGGLNYQSYDPGCFLDKLPGDAIEHPTTDRANRKFSLAATIAALANTSSAMVRDLNPLVETFKPVLDVSVRVLNNTVWEPLFGIVAGLVVIGLMRRAKRAENARDISVALGSALFIVVAVTFVVGYPTRATSLVHEPASEAMGTIKDAFTDQAPGADPGVAGQATLYETLVWKPFMGGVFCTTTGPTFDTYAGPLFAASVFTRWEDAQQRADPTGVGATLAAEKQAEWQRIADEIQQVDPDAYECLKSARPTEQGEYANAALVSISTVGGAQIVTNVMFLVTAVFALLLIALFPLLGLLGLWNTSWVTGPWARAAELAVKVFLWAVVVQVLVNVSDELYDEMDPLLASMIVAGVLLSAVAAQTTSAVKRRRRKREGRPDRPRGRTRPDTPTRPDMPSTPPPPPQAPREQAPREQATRPPARVAEPVGPAVTGAPDRAALPPRTADGAPVAPVRESWVAAPKKPTTPPPGGGESGFVSSHSGPTIRMTPVTREDGSTVWRSEDVVARSTPVRTTNGSPSAPPRPGRESWSTPHRPAPPKPVTVPVPVKKG